LRGSTYLSPTSNALSPQMHLVTSRTTRDIEIGFFYWAWAAWSLSREADAPGLSATCQPNNGNSYYLSSFELSQRWQQACLFRTSTYIQSTPQPRHAIAVDVVSSLCKGVENTHCWRSLILWESFSSSSSQIFCIFFYPLKLDRDL